MLILSTLLELMLMKAIYTITTAGTQQQRPMGTATIRYLPKPIATTLYAKEFSAATALTLISQSTILMLSQDGIISKII